VPGIAGDGGNGGQGGTGSAAKVSGTGGAGGGGGVGGKGGGGWNGANGSNGGNGGNGGDAGVDGGAGRSVGGYGGGGGIGALGGTGYTPGGGSGGANGVSGTNGNPGTPPPSTDVVSASAQAETQDTLLTQIAQRLNYIFFNITPSVEPTQSANLGDAKIVNGSLNAKSNNGFDVTYTVTQAPKYGKLEFDNETGKYVYTVDPTLIDAGIRDSFTASVENASGAKLPGFAGLIQDTLHGLAVALGLAQPDTYEAVVPLVIGGDGQYGKPADQIQYWVKQSYSNCGLMAGAMAIGQIYQSLAKQPSEAKIVDQAKLTDSVTKPGQKIYLDENINEGTTTEDLAALLTRYYDVNTQLTRYSTSVEVDGETTQVSTAADGQRALFDVKAALAKGSAVIATVNAQTVWAAVNGGNTGNTEPEIPDYQENNHAVVVIGIDERKGIVFLNDSGPSFQAEKDEDGNLKYPNGEPVTIGAFMSAWQTNAYQTLVITLPQPQG
jgi:hypothetical protein